MADYRLDTDKTWHQTYTALGSCFNRWPGVTSWRVDHNTTPNRLNAAGAVRSENAVTVRFTKGDREVVLSLDTQDSPRSNLRALFLCIDAMRLMDYRGVGEVAATAYRQLAGPQGPVVRDPFLVLGLRPDASLEDIEDMYRVKARRTHPDRGGDAEAFKELIAAYEEAKRRRA